MAVRETTILLDVIANADPLSQVNRQMDGIIGQTRLMGRSYEGLTDASKSMMREMNSGWRNQNAAFLKFRNDLVAAEYDYHNLARGTAFFGDATDDLIRAITQVGAAHKKATDGMMANDDRARQSVYRTIGAYANMTPQADRNAAALARMNNPLYNANRAGLAVVGQLNRIANNANTARVALEQLGPNANMKELNDEIQRLNRGLGAMPIVAIGAGLAAYFFYGAIHRAAMENQRYADSFNTMVSTLRKAIQPMIDVFIMIMVPVYNFITAIGQMIIRFNEAHPVIARMIQGVLLLVPALTLLLLPLGLGIGYVAGLRLAFGMLFRSLAPVITFLATMSATVWIVAAAIIALGALLIYLWRNNETFKNGVIAAWNAIKSAAMAVWGFLAPYINQAITAVVTFVQAKMTQLQTWWATNGQMIRQAAQTVWTAITAVIRGAMTVIGAIMTVVWPVILMVIQSVWNAIKGVINGAIMVITGIIQFFSAALTGNWSAAWNAVKQIVVGAVMVIWNAISLTLIGRGLMGIRMFLTSIRTIFATGFAAARTIVTTAISNIRTAISTGFNAARSAVVNAVNSIRASITSAFATIRSVISNAVQAAVSAVRNAFNAMRSTVTSIMTAIRTAISSAWNNIMSYLRGIDLTSIGRNIMQGLLNGISSMAGAIMDKVRSIGNSVKDAFTSMMKIHSPSRVFLEYGVNTVEGFNLGVDRTLPDLTRQVNTMAHVAMAPMSSASSYTSSGSGATASNYSNSSVNISPNIQITVQGGEGGNVRKQVSDGISDAFDYLRLMYDPEVVY